MTSPLRGVQSSFLEHLTAVAPDALPGAGFGGGGQTRSVSGGASGGAATAVPHGTTIVALKFVGGVLLAGDRRATMGNLIAQRDITKTFVTDDFTAVGIAGTAGIAKQIVKLFEVELEHYEKIEGTPLSFDGKANRLGAMVRNNFGAALQGLVAVPLLVGYDTAEQRGRIISYDVTGDGHDEVEYQSIGSGSAWAKSSIKKRFLPELSVAAALDVAAEALLDAADDDSATGGPDVMRSLYPTAIVVSADGAAEVPQSEVAAATTRIVAQRTEVGGNS